jgi:hypothetical protein
MRLPILSSLLLLLFRCPAIHQEDISSGAKRVRVWVPMPPDWPEIDRALRVLDWRVGHQPGAAGPLGCGIHLPRV